MFFFVIYLIGSSLQAGTEHKSHTCAREVHIFLKNVCHVLCVTRVPSLYRRVRGQRWPSVPSDTQARVAPAKRSLRPGTACFAR